MNYHMLSPGSVCVLAILAQYSMNLCVYPTGFGRCPFGCSADPCRTTCNQSCRPIWDKCRAFWTTHYTLRSQNRRKHISGSCKRSSFSHGSKHHRKNRTYPQRGHLPSMIKVFATRLIGKQGHEASSFEQRSLIKLSWVHMPFRFCRAQIHISVVTYFHNNSLLACVETNRIKTSCFEAMSNEK